MALPPKQENCNQERILRNCGEGAVQRGDGNAEQVEVGIGKEAGKTTDQEIVIHSNGHQEAMGWVWGRDTVREQAPETS